MGEIEKTQKKEAGEEVEHPVFAFGATGEELERGVAGKAEAEAVGDGPGEWDGDNGEEGRDGNGRVVPLDGSEAGKHESADEDEGGCGGKVGDGSYEGREEEGAEEEESGHDGGDTGTTSGSDSRRGFDVAGDGAGAGE